MKNNFFHNLNPVSYQNESSTYKVSYTFGTWKTEKLYTPASSKPGGGIGLHLKRETHQVRVLHCKLYEGYFFNDRAVEYVQCFNSHLQISQLASSSLMTFFSLHKG